MFQTCHEKLFPQGICPRCVTSALAAQDFRSLVQNSARLWCDVLSSLEDLPNLIIPPTKAICAFMNENTLDVHILTDYPKDSTSILDYVKPKKKPNKTYPHIRTVRKPRVHKAGPPAGCPDCGKQFQSPHYLSLHLRNSSQKEACPHCGVVCIRGSELKTHLESCHNEKWSMCDECPLLLPDEKEIKTHKREGHRAGVHTCMDCGRSFARAATFEAHSQMHAVRTCRTCGAQYDNRACYREHRARCEPDAKPVVKTLPRSRRVNIRDPATYTCDYCGKTYKSRPQLKNHIIWIHMDVRPHQCQWCGKRFYTPARLAEHTVVHTRERNFGCDICGAKLVSKMAAVYHRRRHTGEKPYECEDCGDTFISASRRLEHAKRRHGKGPKFQCTDCAASFVRSHELRKHILKTHSRKNFSEIVI